MSLKLKLSLLFFISFLILGVITLPHYGINWDEPTHFMRGQAFLHFFLTGKKDFKNLPQFENYYQKDNIIFFSPVNKDKNSLKRRSLYQMNGYEFAYWEKTDEKSHPPFSGIMAAFFNYIFFQKLGLINDVDSHNLFASFVAAILVGIIFFWISSLYGKFSGTIAAFSLFLYPLFLSEAHFNIKDVPETVFYSLTLITFYEGITRKSIKWLMLSSLFFGLGFSTKFNIVFAVPIMGLWFLIYVITNILEIKKIIKLIPILIMFPFIAFAFFVGFWPAIWSAPLKGLMESINYYKSIGVSTTFDPRYLIFNGFNTYPLQWILFTTPIIILLLSLIGIIYMFHKGRKEKNKTSILIFLWFTMPIARVVMPDASIYGGVRQIMEYIPAMAILSGIGAKYIIELLNCYIAKKVHLNLITIKQLNNLTIKPLFIAQLLIVLAFLPITLKLISIHPNEGVYFNPLIGGVKGAKETGLPYWGETLGNPYRQGLAWINQNAEKNAKLALTYGLGSNLPSVFIRQDVYFSNSYRGYDYTSGEYIIGLTHKNIYENTYYAKYAEKFLNPVYEIKIDNVPILKVWKNDFTHTKPEYKKELLFAKEINLILKETYLIFNLGEKINLRRLRLFYENGNCIKNAEEINLLTSLDNINWESPEDNVGKYILENGFFDKQNFYNYYFSGIKARFIKIDFKTKNSCINNLIKSEIYTL